MGGDANKSLTKELVIHPGSGPSGLLTSIITLAVRDALNPSEPQHFESAWLYLGSELYRQHLTWLDLPPEYKPSAFIESELDDFLNISKRMRSNNHHEIQGS